MTKKGGRRPGAGRKVDPANPGMPRDNRINLLLPDELDAYIEDRTRAWETGSRAETVREIIRRWMARRIGGNG